MVLGWLLPYEIMNDPRATKLFLILLMNTSARRSLEPT